MREDPQIPKSLSPALISLDSLNQVAWIQFGPVSLMLKQLQQDCWMRIYSNSTNRLIDMLVVGPNFELEVFKQLSRWQHNPLWILQLIKRDISDYWEYR